MGKIIKLDGSVRIQAGLSCALFLAAGLAGILEHAEAAIALLAVGNIIFLTMIGVLERRRHRAQRSLLHAVKALSTEIARSNDRVQKEHKQLTNGLGLVSRQLRDITASVSGEESWVSKQNERQLAIFLRALNVNRREIVDGLSSKRAISTEKQ